MLARGIDAIELDGNSPATAGLIVKQARELGFTGRIVRTGGPATQEIINVAGKGATQGMFVHAPVDPQLPSTQAYAALYAAKYKHPMNGFSPAFYDGTNLLFEAMRRTGTVDDTDKVRAELAHQRLPGRAGHAGLDRQGHVRHRPPAQRAVLRGRSAGRQEIIRARCTVEGCR